MSAFATAADLVARYPESECVVASLRQAALDEAQDVLCDQAWGSSLRRGHMLLAMHYLAREGRIEGQAQQGGGPLQSWSAGELSATYAVSTAAIDPFLGSTRYGQLFLELYKSIPYQPETC